MNHTAPANTDFSKGSVLSNIVRMGGTITFALLINALYNVVDRIYLGRIPGVGGDALTGVGLVYPILCIITAFQSLCSTGAGPLFAMARGRRDQDEAERILGNAYALLLFLGVALTAVGFLVKEPVLWLTGASDVTFHYANDYLGIYLLGTPFALTSLGMNPFINAQGYARTGMFTVLIGAVLNIALDPVFIYGLDMGVEGAALATIISQFCSAVWVFRFLTGRQALQKLRLSRMKPDFRILGRTVSLGCSGFIMAVTNSAVGIVYNSQLQLLGGDPYVGAMTVVNTMRELVFLPVSGVRTGAQPVISYNYGAGLYSRVRECVRILMKIYLSLTLAMWVMLMFFTEGVVSLFNSNPELVGIAVKAVRIYFSALFVHSFMMTGQCVCQSLGMARQTIFFSLFRKAIMVIPLIYLLPDMWGLGIYGVFYSEPISEVVASIGCFTAMLYTLRRTLPREDNPVAEGGSSAQ